MNEIFRRFNSGDTLYPPVKPYDVRMLPVGDGHRVYVEQCGSPQGIPVLCLHGGPGGGCNPTMRRFFDPAHYRTILFDQRGCGKSSPTACIEANTTQHLLADIELIRKTLGIDRWILFGGSWGSTLALLYAQEHPETVAQLVLRAVFLMTQCELDWFYAGGAARFWPDQWEKLTDPLPEDERGDLVAAYHKRMFSGDAAAETRFGTIWNEWETTLCRMEGAGMGGNGSANYVRTFAKLECHYFLNKGFLSSDSQILDNIHKISGIPGTIVHGRYDVVCPPETAWNLSRKWKEAELKIVVAGHALSETAIRAELVATMNRLKAGARFGGANF